MGFLSEGSYSKPKLIENKVVKRILDNESNKLSFENKVKDYLIDFVKLHYKIILAIFLFCSLLYWRYIEIQKIRNKKNDTDYDSD